MADLVFIVLTLALFLGLTALLAGLDRAVAPGLTPTNLAASPASQCTPAVAVGTADGGAQDAGAASAGGADKPAAARTSA